MKLKPRRFAAIMLALLPVLGVAADADDDDAAGDPKALPALTADQQRAAGIVVAHPVNATLPQRDEAIGLVLDPMALIGDATEADAAAAAARAASAELERARGLYGAGTGTSLKAVQAAESEQAHMHAQAETAAARFATHWKPVATMHAAARQKLLSDLATGAALLVRADLPGRHLIGAVPDRALLDVDGLQVPGRIAGVLGQTAEDAQGVGVLIIVDHAPAGLGAGARVPVALLGAQNAGVLVPRDAVLYGDGGAIVYKQLAKGNDPQAHYAPVPVKLLQAHADGWLVDGIDDDDNIVIHGAGVLWSLQGLVGHAAGDIDDND